MIKLLGFDAREDHRVGGGGTYAMEAIDERRYDIQYWLREWGWDRARCQREIADAGLPVPEKSACYMCPASKKQEVVELSVAEPGQHGLALALEFNYRDGKHWRGEAASTIGLGRRFAWNDLEG